MGNADIDTLETPESAVLRGPIVSATHSGPGPPVRVEPDLKFIRNLEQTLGAKFKTCMQCGTCSGTCTLSPDQHAFPCKEMAWATWGMKERLAGDVDVWLCHQCNDCSTRCPRGARPGDVLAAIRQECIKDYSFPRFLGRWTNQPQGLMLLLGIATAVLTFALYWQEQLATWFGFSPSMGDRFSYAYSAYLPHWLLNGLFGIFFGLVIVIMAVGVIRMWRAMKPGTEQLGIMRPATGLLAALGTTLKSIVTHDNFKVCEESRPRAWSHSFVFFGFLALTMVTLWVITSSINPLITGKFIYPFGFFSPWKMLANLGGLALTVGLALMIKDRLTAADDKAVSTYSDWYLIGLLLVVTLSGFATEILHYVRLEPHRHLVYLVHLICVFTLLIFLPYSKLAHVVYRTTAMVYATYFGREIGQPRVLASPESGKEVEHV